MLNRFFTKNFSFILLGFSFLGLLFPDPGKLLSFLITGLLFIVIFASSFQFKLHDISQKHTLKRSSLYSIARYILVPLCIYFILLPISKFYAFSFFFISLLPSGASSPAITSLLKGDFSQAILILVFSSLLAIISIPVLVPAVYEADTTVSSFPLLKTLVITILAPFLIHIPFRKSGSINRGITRNLPIITVTCISLLLMVIVSSNKEVIFNHPGLVVQYSLISFGLFGFLYIAGYFLPLKSPFPSRIAFSVSSGLNNLGLGVTLAALFLDPMYVVFFITSELAWVAILVPVKYLFKRLGANQDTKKKGV